VIPLYVYDFDKTLIPFDSFRVYVFYWLRHIPFEMSKLLILRKLRIYTAEKFKLKVIQSVIIHPDFEELNQKFVIKILTNVNQSTLKKAPVLEAMPNHVLILSASPDIYIGKVASALGIYGKGSFIDNDSFFHLYSSGKVKFLVENYPKSTYRYVYSVSDSKSDMVLLELFESYELI